MSIHIRSDLIKDIKHLLTDCVANANNIGTAALTYEENGTKKTFRAVDLKMKRI